MEIKGPYRNSIEGLKGDNINMNMMKFPPKKLREQVI